MKPNKPKLMYELLGEYADELIKQAHKDIAQVHGKADEQNK